jgi:hypothetical protein
MVIKYPFKMNQALHPDKSTILRKTMEEYLTYTTFHTITFKSWRTLAFTTINILSTVKLETGTKYIYWRITSWET